MNIVFRTTGDFLASVRMDLMRPHAFAHERVGFISVRATATDRSLIVLAQSYHPVADADYIRAKRVGALIGQEALRKALEIALLNPVGIFHVHMHDFPGPLWFSDIDLREQLQFIPDFFKVRSKMPHGAVVLGPRSAAGRVWLAPDRIERIAEFYTVGPSIRVSQSDTNGVVAD